MAFGSMRLGLGLSQRRRALITTEVPVDEPSESDGEADELDTGTMIFDGGFSDAPTIQNQGNGKRVGGTSKDYAKFLFSIGVPTAGFQYTMTYDPDFSGLSQGGALAMVGFGFKDGNKYHFAGLRGDGDTGLNAYQVSGPNFNNLKASTETDGGAATNGTQAGPNWLRIAIAEDGSTYSLSTSSDGESWDEELTEAVPVPLDSATDAGDFGIAIYLDAADQGAFAVDVTLWEQGEAASGGAAPLDIVDTYSSGSAAAVHTRTDLDIGAADANRVVICTLGWVGAFGASRTLSSVTIGGESATLIGDTAAGSEGGLTMAYAELPEGATATVEVTFSGTTNLSMVTYRTVVGSATPADTGSNSGSTGSGTPITAAVDVKDGGILIFNGRTDANATQDVHYDGTDTIDSHDHVGAATFQHASGTTTEDATRNPGFSSGTTSTKKILAATWV